MVREEVGLPLANLMAPPTDRRVMAHLVHEVRRQEKVSVRFGFALAAQDDLSKDSKAGVLSVRFISTTHTILPPSDKQFRVSDRYGHFVYFGAEGGAEYGEFDRDFVVPYHANKFVLTLMPFSNPTVRIVSLSTTIRLLE